VAGHDHKDHNYSPMLPFIDRLFGSFYLPKTWPAEYGTSTPMPNHLIGQLVDPFAPASWETDRQALGVKTLAVEMAIGAVLDRSWPRRKRRRAQTSRHCRRLALGPVRAALAKNAGSLSLSQQGVKNNRCMNSLVQSPASQEIGER
jgi:hypothetical protein